MYPYPHIFVYAVVTISRLLKIIGLFCKRALYKRLYSAKETYHFKEPTNRSHPIVPAPEASWRKVFDPYTPLLFDLYQYLEQNRYFLLVPEHAPGLSIQVLPGCRVRHPCCPKKLFVQIYIEILYRLSVPHTHSNIHLHITHLDINFVFSHTCTYSRILCSS